MSHRYSKNARDFDDDLSSMLGEHAAEKAAAAKADVEAEKAAARAAAPSLQQIVEAETPLDQIRKIAESKRDKSAADEITEYGLRGELRKLADRQHQAVDDFLAATGD